jgi:hypothetical protein
MNFVELLILTGAAGPFISESFRSICFCSCCFFFLFGWGRARDFFLTALATWLTCNEYEGVPSNWQIFGCRLGDCAQGDVFVKDLYTKHIHVSFHNSISMLAMNKLKPWPFPYTLPVDWVNFGCNTKRELLWTRCVARSLLSDAAAVVVRLPSHCDSTATERRKMWKLLRDGY